MTEERAGVAGPDRTEAGLGRADPLGRRALFWAGRDEHAGDEPGRDEPAGDEHRAPARIPLGKRALFSTAPVSDDELRLEADADPVRGRGPIVVECSTCGVVSRVGVFELALLQFPLGFWLPRGRFDRRMTCPACSRRVWASVTLRRR